MTTHGCNNDCNNDCTSPVSAGSVTSMLTDFYQITMCYGYWKSGKHNDNAVFDLFFRKNPFQGEYTIFCGLQDVLEYLMGFRFSDTDINYFKSILPATIEQEFYAYLRQLDCSQIKLWALPEGSVVFPKVPLLIVEGPLAVAQMLETTLLNLVNFSRCGVDAFSTSDDSMVSRDLGNPTTSICCALPGRPESLVCTNAVRFRLAAGPTAELLEFGLRRAQGPNGAMLASKFCYVGGFDGTSNLLAGQQYGIPVRGTHAHSYVNVFQSVQELQPLLLFSASKSHSIDLRERALAYVDELCAMCPKVVRNEVSDGELAAFLSYAFSFPHGFLALVDTYDVLRSGIINFCAVALALNELEYKAIGIRLDSGDLAYLSREARKFFEMLQEHYAISWFGKMKIIASNDINEDTLCSLREQRHEITCYGIGTHLVTCQKQPALGCVYKLVELNGKPRIKLSQEVEKVTIPGQKLVYRLYGKDGCAINDLMMLSVEEPPQAGSSILCRHPFQENRRAFVTPSRVECIHKLFWANGKMCQPTQSLTDIRESVFKNVQALREDCKRNLNPTPYKVSVSESLYRFIHEMWLQNAPIGQLE